MRRAVAPEISTLFWRDAPQQTLFKRKRAVTSWHGLHELEKNLSSMQFQRLLALAVLGVSMAHAAAFATAPSLELTGTLRACDWPHTRRGTRRNRIGALRAAYDADEWTPLTDEASGNGIRSVGERARGGVCTAVGSPCECRARTRGFVLQTRHASDEDEERRGLQCAKHSDAHLAPPASVAPIVSLTVLASRGLRRVFFCASLLLEQGDRLDIVGEAAPPRREGGGGNGNQRVDGRE
jgi:hypothetical protein